MDKIAQDIQEAFGFVGAVDQHKQRAGRTVDFDVYKSLHVNVVGEFEPVKMYSKSSFFKHDEPMQWGQAFSKYGYTFLQVEGLIYVIENGLILFKYEI